MTGMMEHSDEKRVTRGHPVLAAVYDSVLGPFEERFRPYRRQLLAHASGRILELGAGTGVNFELYSDVPELVPPVHAVEPDPYMRERAARRAAESTVPITLHDSVAESLPFDSGSFDTVVATWVMCTVQDAAQALSEVRRVLTPGGLYLFVEHVRSDHGFIELVQDVATPVWRMVAGGCELNRDTVTEILEQGLELEFKQELKLGSPLLPIVLGGARR